MVAKRNRKPKAGSQSSKKKSRKPKGVRSAGGGGSGGTTGGTLSGMRSGFKSMVGGGSGKGGKQAPGTVSRVIDIALWIAVAAAGVYFISNAQCSG